MKAEKIAPTAWSPPGLPFEMRRLCGQRAHRRNKPYCDWCAQVLPTPRCCGNGGPGGHFSLHETDNDGFGNWGAVVRASEELG